MTPRQAAEPHLGLFMESNSSEFGVDVSTHYAIGSIVVPICGLCLGSDKVVPKLKRNYYGAYG